MMRIFQSISILIVLGLSASAIFAAQESFPLYKDSSKPVADRVNDLIDRMTLDEKALSLYHNSPGIERLGLPCWDGWNQCIHGVWTNNVGTTCFPIPTAQGATWNPDLVREMAGAIADEGRALSNAKIIGLQADLPHGLMFRSPVINILRNPYWGRIQEAYSEDPHLTGRMGVAFVRGLNGDHPKYLKVAATLKHFAVNNVENGRQSHSAVVSERMLHEYWLPHFRDAVVEGKCQSIMAAYNAINGTPCAVDKLLLTDILRDRWGYEGFVVSDLGGIGTMMEGHQNTVNPIEAVSLALEAGCDYDDEHFRDNVAQAVRSGRLSEKIVDQALRRVLRIPFLLGVMDPPESNPYTKIGMDVVDSPKHRALARQVEREAIVLLKNEDEFLPLTSEKLAKVKTIAVIGPAAKNPSYGNYFNRSAPRVSLWNALEKYVAATPNAPKLLYARGSGFIQNTRNANNNESVASERNNAVEIAKQADLVFLALGTNDAIEREGHDRTTLNLPEPQQLLLEAVGTANPNTVLLLAGAGPLSVRWAHDHLPAILSIWYPGEEGGNAILDVLLGYYNPAGRLPYTVYESDDDVPNVHEYDVSKGYTYMYLRKKPQSPFGFGLSYTQFEYTNLRPAASKAAGSYVFEVDVTNKGKVAGDEVVQLYSRRVNRTDNDPLLQLQTFRRVAIAPGETQTVTLTLPGAPIRYYDESIHDFRDVKSGYEICVGASSEDLRLTWRPSEEEQNLSAVDSSSVDPSTVNPFIVNDWLKQDNKTEADAAYIAECLKRRNDRLQTLKKTYPKIVFTKHFDLGGSHYAYTEAQSDGQAERNFYPGSALCLLELGSDGDYHEKTLLEDKNGVIRDPAVTFDGKKIIFAWKKSDRLDDYHLYDYEVETGAIRQLTFGLGYADYEPCPLPNGDIVFNSTRCVQVVDCWWTEVSNLYRCDKEGHFLRRLSFDQVHTNYPTLMEDSRIVYTRWEYNDRGQIFPQGLTQMNPDGTSQTEYYGNNSWFPTTLMHTRAIPGGGGKSVSIFSGHHNRQYGKLGIIDPSKGRQEASGTQLIAPIRETTPDRIDAWGQWGDRFSHPYPISEKEFIVAYNCEYPEPEKPIRNEHDRRTLAEQQHSTRTPFGLYWFNADGERELLAYDEKISCNQPFPLSARTSISMRASIPVLANDAKTGYGTYTMQDVYTGPGMKSVERGTAKTLRVIALGFRSTGIGRNGNHGPAGGALVSTPVAISHGTWDVKIPLGDVPIEEDGSASFIVPAQTPVYFQILDENGHSIQTMRSWSTLQPGETFSCVGCHEDKNTTFQQNNVVMAQLKAPQRLKPFYGAPRGFSFAREIQPILDKHCIDCHQNDAQLPPYEDRRVGSGGEGKNNIPMNTARQIVAKPVLQTGEPWYYTEEPPPDHWMMPDFFNQVAHDFPQSKGAFGNAPSDRPKTEWNTQKIWIWRTVQLPEDWENQPLLLKYFHDENMTLYANGKEVFTAAGHNVGYDYAYLTKQDTQAFKPGINYLAACVLDSGGGRGVDLGLWQIKPNANIALRDNHMNVAESDLNNAFSLKSHPVYDPMAQRFWSRSYLNLTNSFQPKEGEPYVGRQTPVVNWINVQDAPPMLPPYKAGAACSDLMKMFDPKLALNGKTHHDLRLSQEELDKLSLWIDLLVPFCGDYKEAQAWSEHDLERYEYYEGKKKAMDELDRTNRLKLVSYAQNGTVPEEFWGDAAAANPYRNLAFNPEAVDGKDGEKPAVYPAASSNSVCRGESVFAALNCIDGNRNNKGHGTDFPSWGPEQNVENLWWKVDFGKPVQTDQIVLTIRADFPHDTYWRKCTIEMSNGFKHRIDLQKTSNPQIFRFAPQRTEWIKLTDFEVAEPGWAALTEVEVMGTDDVTDERTN